MSETNTAASFDQLGLSEVALSCVHDLGYETPTPVQTQAIPAVLAGRDVMAAAQTGTGKTAAFLLPTLDRLPHVGSGDARGKGPLMLVVTPTRELAQQIETCARAICARTRHTCTVVVGGVGYEPQRNALAQGCDLLVATPGRLMDLMNQGACNLKQVQVLVIDEADRMLDMGFLPAMRKIVAKIPQTRQTLLFSATLGEDVLANTQSLVRDPVRVEIAHKGTAAQTIDQYVLGLTPTVKVSVLAQVLRREGSKRVIVFCRGKHRADMICRKLKKVGIDSAPIHGNRSQSQRETALRRFSDGEVGVLVATDVLARGIDIADVAYVVNLDVPSDAEDYIHRIGRTGRAGEYGWALTFVTEDEYLDLRDIEQLMGKIIPPYPRAEDLDLGESPFVPDPGRDPREKLPGKRMRKKLQAERDRARERAVAAGHDGEPEAGGAWAGEAGTERPTRGSRGGAERAEHIGRGGASRAARASEERPAEGIPRVGGSSRTASLARAAAASRSTRGEQPQPKGAGNKKSAAHNTRTPRPARSDRDGYGDRPERDGYGDRSERDGRTDRQASRPARSDQRRSESVGPQHRTSETQPPSRTAASASVDGKPRRRPGDHGGAGARRN